MAKSDLRRRGPTLTAIPCSIRKARIWLIVAVRGHQPRPHHRVISLRPKKAERTGTRRFVGISLARLIEPRHRVCVEQVGLQPIQPLPAIRQFRQRWRNVSRANPISQKAVVHADFTCRCQYPQKSADLLLFIASATMRSTSNHRRYAYGLRATQLLGQHV